MPNLLELLGLQSSSSAAQPIQQIDPGASAYASFDDAFRDFPAPSQPEAEQEINNVLAAIAGGNQPIAAPVSSADVASATRASTPTVTRTPRDRASILDIIGGIADSVASVGGAQPLYRMNLDAAAERARQVDLDAMRKAQFGQQQALGGQQLQAGELEIGNAEREQIGQALAGIVGSENPAEAWGVIAQQAGIPPDKTAAIGQALQQNPEMAGQLAQAFGYEPPKQGSLPSAVQNYGMYQKILRTQGPEAAEQFRQFAMPSQTMLTPAQAAQIGISQERLGIAQDTLAWAQDPNNPLNQQRAAAAAKAAGGGEGGSDVAQILNDFGVRLEGKEDPVAELIRNSTSGRLESWASMIPGAFGHATTGQENIGRLETIDNAIVLGLAGGKLGTGVSNADRDFFKEMSGKISDPTIPIEQRLAAWAQLKPRLRGIVQRGRAPVARQGPAPARQVRGGVADPALEAAMRRRGLK